VIPLALFVIAVGCNGAEDYNLYWKYTFQVIASIGKDAAVRDAAEFLYQKRQSVCTSFMAEWDGDGKKFNFEDQLENDIDWKGTRIQIVGHGDGKTVGGLSPKELAEGIHQLTGGESLKKISVVSCMNKEKGKGIMSQDAPQYLDDFMNELKDTGIRSTEVSMRSALVAVDEQGRKLIGEAWYSTTPGTKALVESGIKWSHDNKGYKWIGTIDDDGNIEKSQKAPLDGEYVTRFFGVLPKDLNPYVTEYGDSISYKLPNKAAYDMLKEAAKEVYGEAAGDRKRSTPRYEVDMYNKNDRKFITQDMELREIQSADDLVYELRYQAERFRKSTRAVEHYRFGSFVVEMKLSNFYVSVVGLVEKAFDHDSTDTMRDIEDSWPAEGFPVEYQDMEPKTSPDYFKHVQDWINGKNGAMKTNVQNYEEDANDAQCGAAMFMSESIRCFYNHLTNMMALDLADDGFLVKECFFARDVAPMAQGGTWRHKKAVGIDYMDKYENTDDGQGVIERMSRVTKTWLSHLEQEDFSGSLDRAAGTDRDTPNYDAANDKLGLQDTIKTVAIRNPGPNDMLRKYEQKFPDRLISTEISEPEVKSMETQNEEFSTAEDTSAPFRASLALAADHAYISKALQGAIEEEEEKQGKEYEMEPDSVEMSENEQSNDFEVTFTVYDKANPADTEELSTTIEDSKLGSKNLLEDYQEQASDPANQPSEGHGKLSYINKGLAIHGVLAGLGGALGDFEEGKYAKGAIGMAQGLNGLSDLAGINQKIWEAAKGLLKKALQEPLSQLSKTPLAEDGEEFASKEISSTMGSIDMSFLDDIPIIGTAFAIYNIVEDFKQHTTLGYIDAGLDIALTGLAFFGPEAEPFVIALSIIRMGINTFYNDISKELSNLPSNATLTQKTVAVFIGIEDTAVDLWEQFTLWGEIYSAVKQSKKLNQEYEKQQKFLKSLTDFDNYYKVMIQPGSHYKQINFVSGSLSLFGGGIQFTLGEDGTSKLTIEIFDSKHEESNVTHTITTNGVEDITMGIGESYTFTFSKRQAKVAFCIPVYTKWLISGNKTDKHSLHGSYTGNSKDNRFFAVQELPPKLRSLFKLYTYHYILYGRDGNDFFYLGPQITYVEGNEGSDTYYITNHTTTTTVNNFAHDHQTDFLIFDIDFADIDSAIRVGQDAVMSTSKGTTGKHLVRLEDWFTGTAYQHLTIKTKDGVFFSVSATGIHGELKLVPYAYIIEDGRRLDARGPGMFNVKTIIGSNLDDHFDGNNLDNHIDGKGGYNTVAGHNGKDIYVVGDGSYTTINNYAADQKNDMILFCASTYYDMHVKPAGTSGIRISSSDNCRVDLEMWCTNSSYRHLNIVSRDGVVYNISAGAVPRFIPTLVDLSLQRYVSHHTEGDRGKERGDRRKGRG
jgi:hypothetical protein